jgi:uncharacterized protein YrrD
MTVPLLRGRDVVGSPVVSIASGDDLAEVRDVVFDPNQGLITGFTLNQRGRFKGRLRALLPIDTVAAVGTDAVMVASDDALVDPDDAPATVTAARREDDVLHDLVVTASGRQLGTVQDVVLLGGPTPRVVGFEIGGGDVGTGLIPVGQQEGVSGSALIVPDGFESRVRTDLTGLAAELVDLERERS